MHALSWCLDIANSSILFSSKWHLCTVHCAFNSQKHRNVDRRGGGGGGAKGVSNINSVYFIYIMPKIGGPRPPLPPGSYAYETAFINVLVVLRQR